MAVWSKRISVGTSPTRVDDYETALNIVILVRNRSGVSVFLGGSAVTTSAGYELADGEAVTLRMPTATGGLYAVAASGSNNRVDRMQVSS